MQGKVCLHAGTHSTQPCFSSSFCPSATSPKIKPWLTWIYCPIGFRGKLQKFPFGWSLYYERWSHKTPAQGGSLLWFQVPSQNIIPLISYSGMGSPGNAGDISPGRQFSTDGQCVFSLPVPEQTTHSLTLSCTAWESLAGWGWCHKYLGRLQYLCLTLAEGELHVPPKYLLSQICRAQELNLLSCYVKWEWRSQNMFY